MREREPQASVAEFLSFALPAGWPEINAQQIIDGFWANVDRSGGPSECWPWRGATNRAGGYGIISLAARIGDVVVKRNIYAHRLAIVIAGRPLLPAQQACHRCDVPACCNEAHLFAGTRSDNMRDAAAKGRLSGFPPGVRPPSTRLVADQVREIKRLLCDRSLTQRAITNKFGVSEACIQHIHAGWTWRNVA